MEILRRLKVPTGDILIVQGTHGFLEMLSLGDYGKNANIVSTALGLTRELPQVLHQPMLSLEEKWVVTISTQYGCRMACNFCDVPRVGCGRNATFNDLIQQVLTGVHLHPEIKSTKRLNVHFARMGEPTWNPEVLDATKWLKRHLDPEYRIHPVVSTMMPVKNIWLKTFIHAWMRIKNRLLNGEAGLQLSINSTNEVERTKMFHAGACSLEQIARVMDGVVPFGRKITLNFAVAQYEIDPQVLLRYFNPELYLVKLTPMHATSAAKTIGLETQGDPCSSSAYTDVQRALETAGYDVLVFVASQEEDASRITCGNAILAGTVPECTYSEVYARDAMA
jgi:23S rRNA (adenine2503-C2)-methyltransferase